jgi:hypothetical protein
MVAATPLEAGEAVLAVEVGEELPVGVPVPHPAVMPMMMSSRTSAPTEMPLFRRPPPRVLNLIKIPLPITNDARSGPADYQQLHIFFEQFPSQRNASGEQVSAWDPQALVHVNLGLTTPWSAGERPVQQQGQQPVIAHCAEQVPARVPKG